MCTGQWEKVILIGSLMQKNPQPNPAPFQKEIIGEKFKDLYNLTFSEVVKKNILNLKSN